jgi:glycosyltransferase involved in cell wall biosynthesis
VRPPFAVALGVILLPERGPASQSLRIALDARLVSGELGGVEQVIIGLASGLSALPVEGEEYRFMVYPGQAAWLEPYVGGACGLFEVPPPADWKRALVRSFPRLAAARREILWRLAPAAPGMSVPVSNGALERGGFDIVHFTKQDAFRTRIPSIYHPHDLQHVHLPEFFSEEQRLRRDLEYRAFCEQADMVAVTSRWGRQDLIEHYGLPPDRVAVIPLAPAIAAYEGPDPDEAEESVAQMDLPAQFAFYPAQTYPHKNHVRLIEALALLRDRGARIPLVCSGRQSEYYQTIRAAVVAAGLSESVSFVGFVSPGTLRVLYRRARILVMPTLFEAAGGFGPIAEAFASGVPVACSDVTSLPEQVGDAALVFDPYDVESIAHAVGRLWSDAEERGLLTERGRARIAGFTWDRVARVFRAHYRRICTRPLSDEDVSAIAQATEF